MIKLTFSPTLAGALQRRVHELLHEVDQDLANRLAHAEDPLELPQELAIYEQALTMLTVEVLVNVTMALRMSFGPHGDSHFEPLVAEALRRTLEARDAADAKRKAGQS